MISCEDRIILLSLIKSQKHSTQILQQKANACNDVVGPKCNYDLVHETIKAEAMMATYILIQKKIDSQ